MSKSPVGALAVSFAIVATLYVLGQFIPLAGIAQSDPFVETGRTSGCIYGLMS